MFARLGAVSFGGPAAHIALMERELVGERGWLTREEFLDLLGAANLVPGPTSTELALHIGLRRAGWRGLLAAGVGFILPATFIVALAAWAYTRFGARPEVAGLLYGVKPVMVAVVAAALWGLARTAVRTKPQAALGLFCLAACFIGAHPLAVLCAAGGILSTVRWARHERGLGARPVLGFALAAAVLLGAPSLLAAGVGRAGIAAGTRGLFLYFLKIGSVLYGSGYVLLAFLRTDLVSRWHWLTAGQLLDATAVGQVTPGPVFTTATFIGWVLGGPVGAAVSTVGIFLPSFFYVGLSGPLVTRLRRSPLAGAFLNGVNIGSLALMVAVTWALGRAALVDPLTAGIGLVSLFLLVYRRVNATWLIAGGALLGSAARLFGRGL